MILIEYALIFALLAAALFWWLTRMTKRDTDAERDALRAEVVRMTRLHDALSIMGREAPDPIIFHDASRTDLPVSWRSAAAETLAADPTYLAMVEASAPRSVNDPRRLRWSGYSVVITRHKTPSGPMIRVQASP